MTKSARSGLTRFVRAVEALWSAHAQRPIVLSPREFALVSDWHQRGIPLDLIRELIAARAENPRRRTTGARSLRQIAGAVEESWSAIVDGQSAKPVLRPGHGPRRESPDDPESWQRRLAGRPGADAMSSWLRELGARALAGEAREVIAQELEDRLPEFAPAELRERAERDVDRDLAPFRERMPPARFAQTRRRAVGARLRSLTGLG